MKSCPNNGICKGDGCEIWDEHANCCAYLSTVLTLRQLMFILRKQTHYMEPKQVRDLNICPTCGGECWDICTGYESAEIEGY